MHAKDTPANSAALEVLMLRELGPLMSRLAEDHSVIVVAVCAVEHTELCHVISSMDSYDAAAALSAALTSYASRDELDG